MAKMIAHPRPNHSPEVLYLLVLVVTKSGLSQPGLLIIRARGQQGQGEKGRSHQIKGSVHSKNYRLKYPPMNKNHAIQYYVLLGAQQLLQSSFHQFTLIYDFNTISHSENNPDKVEAGY